MCSLCLNPVAPARAEEPSARTWRPADGPLMTRWGREVTPESVLPEYPRPQMVREHWKNLNGLWQFSTAKADEAPPLGRDLEQQILVPFPIESALSGVGTHTDRAWYRRTFEVPASWKSKRVLLHLGAVDWEATVWVNGKQLTTHRGGYDAFTVDVTDALIDAPVQELVVGVFDPTDEGTQPRGKQVRQPRGIWYTPTTGIWQTVWLEAVPQASIEALHLVPDVDRGLLVVTVTGRGTGDAHRVRIEARDADKSVATQTGPIGQRIELPISRPKLWSPEDPSLYDLEVTLLEQDEPVDVVQSYFGMRKISLGKDAQGITRIMLNNEFLFQFGPLDQGFWPDGLYTAPSDAALKYDIEVTKQLGFNMARKHVKVEPARWYYWCDSLGLLVWQDMPNGDRHVPRGGGQITRDAISAQQFESELKQLILGRRNHPCIVMWVVFNEGWGQYDTVRLSDWTSHFDPSRLVCGASGWNDMKISDVIDVHAYPGPQAQAPELQRASVLGEYGGLGLPIQDHTWQDKQNWGYRNLKTPEALEQGYLELLAGLRPLIAQPGLSAAVYTQTTDVGIEVNGLLTYDREIIKIDPKQLSAAHQKLYGPIPRVESLIPTSQQTGQTWRYRLEKPESPRWSDADYDDAQWETGPGGFGTKETPGAVVGTVWDGDDIWLRRSVDIPRQQVEPSAGGDLYLKIHHDEDAMVYLNGKLIAATEGYTRGYRLLPLGPEAREALRPGRNVLAVHCRQTGGGQYIDVGIIQLTTVTK
jgi:hypothetical protein